MTSPESGPPDNGAPRDSEPALGGADAVEKTTYVTGRGTEPESRQKGDASARISGGSVLGWVVGAIALALGLVYMVGVFK